MIQASMNFVDPDFAQLFLPPIVFLYLIHCTVRFERILMRPVLSSLVIRPIFPSKYPAATVSAYRERRSSIKLIRHLESGVEFLQRKLCIAPICFRKYSRFVKFPRSCVRSIILRRNAPKRFSF